MPASENGLDIRRAVSTDRAFVLSLAHRFAETRPPWRSEDEVTRGTVRALSAAFDEPRESEAIFIATGAERGPVAFAFAIEDDDFFTGDAHVHVSEIAALPGGTSAGAPLMAAIEVWARERGSRYVSLHVNVSNAGARALYERLGYDLEYHRMAKVL